MNMETFDRADKIIRKKKMIENSISDWQNNPEDIRCYNSIFCGIGDEAFAKMRDIALAESTEQLRQLKKEFDEL